MDKQDVMTLILLITCTLFLLQVGFWVGYIVCLFT